MKKLYMVRHAKSSWKYDFTDKMRPLKGRGRRDAKLVSQNIDESLYFPEKVYSSTATRAKQTCEIFMNTFKIPFDDVELHDSLYDFGGVTAK